MSFFNKNITKEKLNSMIQQGGFTPFFQPIVSLYNQRIVGFELLARYVMSDGKVIYPNEFISKIEEHDLFNEMTHHLIYRACEFVKNWPEYVFISINVSPIQLKNNNLILILGEFIERNKFFAGRMKIEITETALISDMNKARETICELVNMGFLISMDDFGTGYSSLTWLNELPVETIKIDMSFVSTMLKSKLSRKIVTSIVGLGQNLGIEVIAEGIENENEAEMLRGIGCQFAQGYLFGKPIAGKETLSVLSSNPTKVLNRRLEFMSVDQRAWQISSMYHAPNISICFLNTDLLIIDASNTFASRVCHKKSELINRYIYDIMPGEKEKLMWLREFREKGLPYPPFKVNLPNGETDLVFITRVEDEIDELIGFGIFGFRC